MISRQIHRCTEAEPQDIYDLVHSIRLRFDDVKGGDEIELWMHPERAYRLAAKLLELASVRFYGPEGENATLVDGKIVPDAP